jgi:hypothetical protein
MLKVQILDRCPYCEGVSMVFVVEDTNYKGEPFDRYRPCSMCHGSGEYPKQTIQEQRITSASDPPDWLLGALKMSLLFFAPLANLF